MASDEVERFKASTRLLHWTIALSATVLTVTGLFFLVEGWGFLAEDGYTRVIHRVAAIVLMATPVLYFLLHPVASLKFIGEAFKWGGDDLDWLKAAPDYYFGGEGEDMPAQGHINTGQKLFWLIALICSVGFIVTGLIMWTQGTDVGSGFMLATFIHDICLIVGGSMLVVHVYLGALHPKMKEALRSMITGRASVEYVKDHHGKWYEEEVAGKE
jgi:formate dehydrogenase subunit gamma